MKEIKSPMAAEVGRVTVKAPPVVLQKYPLPATALAGSAVITACQDAPPAAGSPKEAVVPSVVKICQLVPIAIPPKAPLSLN